MLDWILMAAVLPPLLILNRRKRRAARRRREVAEAMAFHLAGIAEMAPVCPPRAANDDIMLPVYDEVERELKQAGYLR